MLYDRDFLKELCHIRHRVTYARVTALTFEEAPVATIEGRITQGSVNIDGASAVRRTCSLTLVAQDFDYSDFTWGLNTKFKLEIGLQNTINDKYPEIIWFSQGLYLITSFNTSRNTNSFTINLQGKDKMALLNGEIGGSLESSVDFGQIEEEDANGNWVIRKVTIENIIREAVHHYGSEPFHNIIINDLPTKGYELLEYRYDTPLYLYGKEWGKFDNAIIENGVKQYSYDANGSEKISLSEINDAHLVRLGITEESEKIRVYIGDMPYYFTKITYGDVAGYRETELVYAGDLIANIGESITSVLDKVKNMLGEYEYFYNLDGQFVFQKKKSTVFVPWDLATDMNISEKSYVDEYDYSFFNGELLTAFNNNPNILNIRNDFSIWGMRSTVSGATVPVHLRYAIDTMPTKYSSIEVEEKNAEVVSYNEKYGTNMGGQGSISYEVSSKTPWQEVLYQMAKDYFKYGHLSDFNLRIVKANGELYPGGRTGYEQYYTDIEGFWRDIYDPDIDEEIKNINDKIAATPFTKEQVDVLKADLKQLGDYIAAKDETQSKAYYDKYKEKAEAVGIDVPSNGENGSEVLYMMKLYLVYLKGKLEDEIKKIEELKDKKKKLEEKQKNFKDNWSLDKLYRPDALNFWIDFLDTNGNLAKYSAKAIGSRPKVINDSNVKGIYFRETPNILFVEALDEDNVAQQQSITKLQYNNDEMFSISAQGISAKEKLDELVNQHTNNIDNITITTLPIYFLEPNSRIYIYDEKTGLDGDYIASKITVPLTYNSTMSITATKEMEL